MIMLRQLLVLISFFGVLNLAYTQDLKHIRIDSINSGYDEFNPVLSPDRNTLYVTRKGHAQNIAGVIDPGDIWFATKTANGWSKLEHLDNGWNHQGLNGIVGFSVDGSRVYLLNYFEKEDDGNGSLKNGIAVSSYVNGQWSVPQKLNIRYFENKSRYLSATISRDEKVMILSMRSFLTEGNEDLYVTFKGDDGRWSQPKGLGTTVNSYGQEWTPFIADDNKTLYFSSNTLPGYGSRDIFVTTRLDDSWTQWSEPLNMGSSINTEGVELGFFLPDGSTEAYFSSTQNSEGRGDVFNYPMSDDIPLQPVVEDVPEQVEPDQEVIASRPSMVVMTFQVLDAETKRPIDADVTLTNKGDTVKVSTAELEGNQKFMKAFAEKDSVRVRIGAAGYLNYNEAFVVMSGGTNNVNGDASNVEAFYLTPIKEEAPIVLENVFFKRGSASFSDKNAAYTQLNTLVKLMNDNPEVRIRLEGHTDNLGNKELLKSLSQNRVKTVRDYLVSQGINPARIDFVGLGGERPIASNDTAEGREQNRRVEFIVIR
jgi:OOP family OmpA-OmpF porin